MAKLLKKLTHNDGGATFVRQKQFTEGTLRYSLYKQTQVTKLLCFLYKSRIHLPLTDRPSAKCVIKKFLVFHLNSMKIVQVVVIYVY